MLNDLMARAAGEVAVRGAKTEKVTPVSRSQSSSGPASPVVTRRTEGGGATTTNPAVLGGGAGAGALALMAAKSALGSKKVTDWLDNALGLGGAGIGAQSFDLSSPQMPQWLADQLATPFSVAPAISYGDVSSAVTETPLYQSIMNPTPVAQALSLEPILAADNILSGAESLLSSGASGLADSFTSVFDGVDPTAFFSGVDPSKLGQNVLEDISWAEDALGSVADATPALVDALPEVTDTVASTVSQGIDMFDLSNTSSELANLASTSSILPAIGMINSIAEGDAIGAGAGAIGLAAGNPIAAVIANIGPIGDAVIGNGLFPVMDAVDTALEQTNFLGVEDVGDAIQNSIADPLFDAADDALGGISDGLASIDDAIRGIFGGGGCFITTAVCEYKGLADDCHELTVLRRFRDTWMATRYNEYIEQYYEEAPALVEKIHALPETSRKALLESLWQQISEAVRLIETGYHNSAFHVYEKMFLQLKSYFGE